MKQEYIRTIGVQLSNLEAMFRYTAPFYTPDAKGTTPCLLLLWIEAATNDYITSAGYKGTEE
jgi:hypothetical protein